MGANKGNKDLEDTLNKAISDALNKETFVFYPSFYESVKMIKDEKTQYRVLCSIIEYGCYGTPIDVSDIDPQGFLSMAIGIVKNDMDMAKDKRDKISKLRSEAGKRGGGQKGNQNARKNNRNESEENDADDADDADDEDDVGDGKNEQDDKTNKTSKNQQNEPYVDVYVDVDGDVDVDGNNKEINNFISNAAAEEQIRKKEDDKLSLDYNKIAAMWNEICTSYPPVQRMTKDRKEKTYQRISEFGLDYESIKALFKKIENSEFLRGKSWATYKWIFDNEDNFAKVIEGQYDKMKPKSFAEVNNNINDLWEERERKAEQRRMLYHPNDYWKDVKFDPSDFS